MRPDRHGADLAAAMPPQPGGDAGLALPTAILGIFALSALIAVMVVTVIGQESATGFEQTWETSLHAAESGAELVLTQVRDDLTVVTRDASGTPHTVPAAVDVTDADQLAGWASGQTATTSPVDLPGLATAWGFRPTVGGAPASFVLGVGAAGEEQRIVRLDLSNTAAGGTGYGILVDDDLLIGGGTNSVTSDTADPAANPADRYETPLPAGAVAAGIHANDDQYLVPGTIEIDGPVTSSDLIRTEFGAMSPTQFKCAGAASGCATSGGQPTVPLPQVAAYDLYQVAADPSTYTGTWYDLCDDGRIYRLDTGLAADGDLDPCESGAILHGSTGTVPGWTFDPSRNLWTISQLRNGNTAGVVLYAHETNIKVDDATGVARFTAIAGRDTSLASDNGFSGSIWVANQADPHVPAMTGLSMHADRDIRITWNINGGFAGVISAGEALEMNGRFDLRGWAIARNDPDTALSLINDNEAMCGRVGAFETAVCNNVHIVYDDDVALPGSAGALHIRAWTEL